MSNLSKLRRIVEEADTPAGRWFDVATQIVIAVSLLSLAIETLPDLSPRARSALRAVELLSVVLFTAEYALRIAAAESRLGYATSFYGIIDLASIVPSLVGFGVDLRSLRAFRLLRIFQVIKLARYSNAIARLHLALKLAKEELVLFGAVTLVILFLSSVGIYEFEKEAQPEHFASVFHSFWWAVVTLTTVGYGDIYPVTAGGRVFTLFVLVAGLGIVSIPPGLLASALSKAREIQEVEAK